MYFDPVVQKSTLFNVGDGMLRYFGLKRRSDLCIYAWQALALSVIMCRLYFCIKLSSALPKVPVVVLHNISIILELHETCTVY